ncbi:MAG TPA: hypothetical protein VM869_23000 [Enhygromyxa sp.]|nr:hypothetical protein [Enhygromyxa sp.]
MLVALAFVGLSLAGPPSLPPEGDELTPPDATPIDEPEPPSDTPEEAPIEAPEDPPEETPVEVPAEPPVDDSAIPVEPEPTPEPEAEPPPSDEPPATGPAVQKPTAKPVTPAVPPSPPAPVVEPEPQPQAQAVEEPEPKLEPEPEEEEESYRKLGGIRLFRIGLAAKIGYTHGTSDKNGLYDRDKSIQDSIDNMMVTSSGAGDLGETKFGGFQYGFILDAEVIGINAWLDFHKFFNPGGMWSLLLGYDHEFGFGKRLRLDIGVAGGLNHVFLGDALSDLYYDKDNPEAVNIGTLGVEGRAMVDLHIKIVGPLFTGPYAMLGYHYLWSADAAEVTAEKGLHYSAGWTLRIDFAAPKLIGGRAKKKSK